MVCYTRSNWFFLNTEQNRNRQTLWATRSFEFPFKECQMWQWFRHHRHEGMRLGSYLGNYTALNIRLRLEIFFAKSSCNYSRLYALAGTSDLASLGKCRKRFWDVMEGNFVLWHRTMARQREAVGSAMEMIFQIATPLNFYPHLQNRQRTILQEHNPVSVNTFVTSEGRVVQKHRMLF